MSGYCIAAIYGFMMLAMEQNLPLYDYVMIRLRAKTIPQRTIARDSGVPFSTVCKIAQGSVTDPSVHTVQRLYDYFTALDRNDASTVNLENTPNIEKAA